MKYVPAAVAILILVRLAVSVASPKGLNWDFNGYHNAGSRVIHGQANDLYNPTAPIAGRPARGAGRQTYYGVPISAYLFVPLAVFEPRTALAILKVQCALVMITGLWLLFPIFTRTTSRLLSPDQAGTVYLIGCLLYAPFWFIFDVGGQASALAFLLLVLFYRAYLDDSSWRAAIWLSLGILTKPLLALGLIAFVLARDWRLLTRFAVVFGIEGALSLILLGRQPHIEWLRFVLSESSRLTEPWWNNTSIPGLLYSFWYGWHGRALESPWQVSPAFQQVVLVFKLLTFGLFVWLASRVNQAELDPVDRRHHWAVLSMLFPLLIASVAWPHYLVFLFLPLMLILVRVDRLPSPVQAIAWLALISTLSVQSRFAQRFVIALLSDHRFWQALTASVFGACTLLLLLLLLIYYPRVVDAQKGLGRLVANHR